MSQFPGVYAFYQNTRATSNRKVKPFILAAIHITDNIGLMSAMNEAIYSNRVGTGASFTFVNNRNGTTVQCLHPEWQIPYTNGSWNRPNYNLWTVNHAIKSRIGANDATFITIENVGSERVGAPITSAQIEKCAQLVAHASRLTGIKPSRATVMGHRDYDSINRMNCPTRGNLDYLLGKIINRANQILTPVAPAPAPAPSVVRVGGFPMVFTPRTGWKATIKAGKPVRNGASTSAANYLITSKDEAWTIWGEVAGEDLTKYGLPGGSRWFFGPIWSRGYRIGYVPYADLKNRNF